MLGTRMPDYRRRAVRDRMTVRLDVNGMMSETIGDRGLAREEVEALTPRTAECLRVLQARLDHGRFLFYERANGSGPLKEVARLAAEVRDQADAFVVLAMGSTAPGIKTLLGALADGKTPAQVIDSVDPASFGQLLDRLDLTRTVFNVISKSGDTADTIAQFLIVRDRLLRILGAVDYKQRVVITTDGEAGGLRQIVNDEGFRDVTMPAGVIGRFSPLSAVGLFPAAVAGGAIDELLAGAAWMEQRSQSQSLWENPACLLGALLYLAATSRDKRIIAIAPYSDRLGLLGAWFRQLWGESVGGAGVVAKKPVAAVGATDPHGFLQLSLEGPRNEVVILVRVEDHGREIEVPAGYADLEGIGYLGGLGLGALLNIEQRAMERTLEKQQRMGMTVTLPQLNAFTLGQLLYLLEAATVFAASLYGVDAFDRPELEMGEELMYGLAGRKGWEEQRLEAEQWLAAKRTQYVL
jgi:glucose-6-phosphate isomerase